MRTHQRSGLTALGCAALIAALGCSESSDPPVVASGSAERATPAAAPAVVRVPLGDELDPSARGPRDAPVVLVEFSDFQCPFSRLASRAVEEAVARHADRVRWVFKSFPLPFHRQAPLAHEAALAAGEWGLFWEMRERIFAHQDALDRALLVELATGLGIPSEEFEAVLQSGSFRSRVEEELEEGRELGVTGTPTFLVNGRRLVGRQSPEVLDYVIRRALGLPAEPPPNAPPQVVLGDPEGGHVLARGPEDAPHVLKVFFDARSPLGKQAIPEVEKLLEAGDRARIVFKARPLGIYDDAPLGHQAILALAARGADFLATWKRVLEAGNFDADNVEAWGRELGLTPRAAREAAVEVAEGRHAGHVAGELALAKRLGVQGSPTLYFDGVRLDGVGGLRVAAGLLQAPEGGRVELPQDAGPGAQEGACGEGDLAAAPASSSPETPASREVVVDFGAAAQGTVVTQVFEIGNTTASAFAITRRRVPPALELLRVPGALAPGGRGELEAAFLTGWSSGTVDLAFELATTSPSAPLFRFRLAGEVSSDVKVTPPAGLVLRGHTGSRERASAEVQVLGQGIGEVTLLSSDLPVDVEIEMPEPGRRARVRAGFSPSARPGQYRTTMRLATEHPRFPELAVPFEAVLEPEIAVSPPALFLRGRSRWLHLRSTLGKPFALRSVRSTLPFLRIVPGRAPREIEHRLLLEPAGDGLPAQARGEVTIEIEKAGANETLHVPVAWSLTGEW